MAPLASFAEVAAQLVVTAFQTGNGLVNLVTPTSAVVMGGLAIGRIGYGTWLRFVWPMLVVLAVLSMVVMSIAVLLQGGYEALVRVSCRRPDRQTWAMRRP